LDLFHGHYRVKCHMSVLLNFILIYLINKTDINSQLKVPFWLFLPHNNGYGLYFIVP